MARMIIEAAELREAKAVRWRCVDGPEDWIGTEVTFALSEADGQTILLFGHCGWREATESPAPRDLKVDNWNGVRRRSTARAA